MPIPLSSASFMKCINLASFGLRLILLSRNLSTPITGEPALVNSIRSLYISILGEYPLNDRSWCITILAINSRIASLGKTALIFLVDPSIYSSLGSSNIVYSKRLFTPTAYPLPPSTERSTTILFAPLYFISLMPLLIKLSNLLISLANSSAPKLVTVYRPNFLITTPDSIMYLRIVFMLLGTGTPLSVKYGAKSNNSKSSSLSSRSVAYPSSNEVLRISSQSFLASSGCSLNFFLEDPTLIYSTPLNLTGYTLARGMTIITTFLLSLSVIKYFRTLA